MNNLFRATSPSSKPIYPQYREAQNLPPILQSANDIPMNRDASSKPPINKKTKKKLDFKAMKKNTISSLNDVEYFLNNFKQISRYIKLIKLFK